MKRFLLLLLIPTTAFAWTRTADQQIAYRAAQLAPRDLRSMIIRYHTQYYAGVDRALAEEGTDVHRAHLRERIESEADDVVRLIRTRKPMQEVVFRLGMLAHFAGDANNPFHVATDPQVESSHADFEGYFERRMQRFPTVFYGLDPRFALPQYVDRTLNRTARFAPLMDEEYFRGGSRHTSADFDDRSTAFGVASICWSHAITDIVNLDYYIWRQAGGDVRQAASMLAPRIIPNAN
ncbi:MAG TPA: hypothetical protein VI391_07950 [Thermoanaerobaculia bacterium]